MDKQNRLKAIAIIAGIWLTLTLINGFASNAGVKTIPYSQFLRMAEEGNVSDVAVTDNVIQGKMLTDSSPSGEGERFQTIRVDSDLSNVLDKNGVEYTGKIHSNFLSSLLSWIFPVLLFLGLWFFIMKRFQQQQGGFMTLGKNKAKIYMENDVQVSFADAAGVDEAKQELVEIIDFLKEPEQFTRIGGQIPRGILLVGPPGTGKTLLAKAVAGESKVPFFSLSGSEFVEMFVGLGAARVRDLFKEAKDNAPCIVFVDELDALGKARGFGAVGGHDEREQTLNQLLVELDGFDPNIGVILMAATNRPEILDPALLRPGRFDRQILVDRPDKQGRKEILEVHLKKVTAADNLDIDILAGMTSGMVGADLANLVNEATLLSVRRKKNEVGMAEFKEAVERVVAGLEKKNRLINPKEKEIVAHHELGHAIVAMTLPETDPVQKISIVPRGIAALGYTMQVPTEDRFLMRRTELLNRIATLLGGRAAEEIVFDDISTGAHNDLSRATDIARSMVKEYGMSRNLGQVYFSHKKQGQFLNPNQDSGGVYSEMTAHLIDKEIRQIIDEQYARALEILNAKRDILGHAAETLLENEVIEGEELKALAVAVSKDDNPDVLRKEHALAA
ncbi:MAG: ATP-dependent zinc metalloprotease FtsH [Desulfobacterales bacterium]|jgi:cell division protease FtsH